MIGKTVLFACAAAIGAPLLAASAWAAAPLPPTPPLAPPAPMAALSPPPAPEAPPAPPHLDMDSWSHGGREVISRVVDGRRMTIIVDRDGASDAKEMLTYKDAEGRTVHVYADHPVTRAEADKMRADAKADGDRARAEGMRAREEGARAREAGARARIEGERARAEAERARAEALIARDSVIGEGRDVASLGRREVRVFQHGDGNAPDVWIDGRPMGGLAAFRAEGPELAALRQEMKALREEMKSVRAELDREHARR